VLVRWPDWCGNANASAHFAIGKLTQRYRKTGQDGAGCGIYHFPVDNPQPAKKLVSVQLPPATDAGGNTQAYLMALTLEAAGGLYETPDLSGTLSFPNDRTAPVTTHAIDPGEPNGNEGWYAGAVRVSLTSADEDGGSQVKQILYRIDGGAPQSYTGPFDYTVEGEHTLEYSAVDNAGNAETYKPIALKVDASAPTTALRQAPEAPKGGSDWYDGSVTVRLAARDGAGSGVKAIEFRMDGATEWTPYTDTITVDEQGVHTLEYRSGDVAGNAETTKTLTLRVDKTAPTTNVLINGAAPADAYTGAVRVAFSRSDAEGSGAVKTEYRLDGGAWTDYTEAGAFDVSGNSGHRVEYRSMDAAGNTENAKSVIFTINPPVTPAAPAPAPVVIPQATPAPVPKPFAALEDVSSRLSTVTAFRGGRMAVRVSCQAVDRGTVSLTVDKAAAKRLKLKSRTLAKGSISCGDQGRGTLTLKPSSKVKRALAKTKSSIIATLSLRLTGAAGAASDTQTVTLKGKS
jgi:hypothetical protein